MEKRKGHHLNVKILPLRHNMYSPTLRINCDSGYIILFPALCVKHFPINSLCLSDFLESSLLTASHVKDGLIQCI